MNAVKHTANTVNITDLLVGNLALDLQQPTDRDHVSLKRPTVNALLTLYKRVIHYEEKCVWQLLPKYEMQLLQHCVVLCLLALEKLTTDEE